MKTGLKRAALAVAVLVWPVHAATHYVCDCQQGSDANCVAGSDNAAGTSQNAPWKTFDKAMNSFGSLPAGDTVAFARGGAFTTAGGRWVNYNAKAQTPVVVTSYTPSWATSDGPQPLIRCTGTGNCFSLENGGNAKHKEGMVIEKLHLAGSDSASWAIFLYNDIDDVVIDSMVIDSFSIGVHAAGSNPPDSGSNALNERITLKNSRITNCSGMGFLGSAPDLLIQNCYFDNNGYAQAVFNHNVYISGHGVRERVIGNVLKHSAMVTGQCQGVSLVVHGDHQDLTIENNLVEEDTGAAGAGCWGIAVDAAYSEPEVFRNVKIRGNAVLNVGNTGIGVSCCRNCLIENNIVIQDQAVGGDGIAVPDRTMDPADTASDSIIVRNNTVYFGAKASSNTGITINDQGTHHQCVNNLVVFSASNASGSYFGFNLPAANYTLIDNNLCYGGGPGVKWEAKAGALAAWRTQSGLDAHSQIADPLFPAAVTAPSQLAPASASPAVNAGLASAAPADDYFGLSRDNQPDIGAIEYRGQAVARAVGLNSPIGSLQSVEIPGGLRLMLPRVFRASSGSISICTLAGKRLLSLNVAATTEINIPLNAPRGIYIVQAAAGNQVWRTVFLRTGGPAKR